ncbi:3-hydroxyacyl-CoA dehydrogenase [Curtobacterium flaccumfaciens]|uniref:3-hydroxyacyl-CoA dehydrogenase n=1 Tax=Curtobacterium flaccumfaciens TaxID=2035 RepID=UPI003879BD6B
MITRETPARERNEPVSQIQSVTVLGAGVLGSQIAFQTAFHGIPATLYDIDEKAVAAARKRVDALAATYADEVAGANADVIAAATKRISFTADLEESVADVDLVVEAVPEVLELKRSVYERIGAAAKPETIFATNSSTLLPSDLKDATGRPERFLALHFANQVWQYNTAEVMGTPDTDPDVFKTVVEFARAIGMVPIPLHKEKAGYVLNSLLVPFLNAALNLAAGGYAQPNDVDTVWRIGTGAPYGPFQIYDVIGLTTPYNILANGDAHDRELAAWLKREYIDRGKLGVAAGEGFYRYPSTDH